MHLFDIDNNMTATKRQFWIVFGSISGVTFVAAAAALLSVQQRSRFKERLAQVFGKRTGVSVGKGKKGKNNNGKGTKSLV
jgi:hypothetical protein